MHSEGRPFKRTKIVATLGPATADPEMIERLIRAGVNTFRLNFSHGTHQEHAQLIQWIKEKRRRLNTAVAILQDLSGPKIRIGQIADPPLQLSPGDEIVLDSSLTVSRGYSIPVTYTDFARDVEVGHRLLLADGSLEVEVIRKNPPRVHARVVVGGMLTSNKGINYPQGSFRLPAITEKDRDDLLFGLEQGVDYVALSFVKTAEDVSQAREICRAHNRTVPLIAKIEKHEAIRNFEEILQEVDGVMVARGDLGVEIPLEQVPLVQKQIIRATNQIGKPVITATQMLLSMVDAPRPTRAEVTDIANAILDGTDAIMLSDETAMGKYPVEAVETMTRIALETEKNFPFYAATESLAHVSETDITRGISGSAAALAHTIQARAILCPTNSGFTARMIARFRPEALVIALTPQWSTYHCLALLWGVIPRFLSVEKHMDKLLNHALDLALKEKFLTSGDRYVITAGFPFGQGARTNLINAGRVGEVP